MILITENTPTSDKKSDVGVFYILLLAAGELFKVSSIYLFIDILLLVAYTKIFL